MWAANGSNEIMLHVLQAFGGPGRTALSFAPTYSMYPEYARDTFTGWVAGRREEDFGLDPDVARAAIAEHAPSVVLLASPNNPTGTALPAETVLAVLDAAARVPGGCVVVVDEAYGEFRRTGTPSALELLADHPHLAVSRTMSKAFGLAGARVGYLAASTALVDALRVVRLPYHLSAVTQAVARAALRHAPALMAQVGSLRDERDALVVWLRERGLTGRRLRRELRAVRPVRRPARDLAGSARPWRPDPRGRTGRMAAGVGRHPAGDGGVQGRPGGGGSDCEPQERRRVPRASSARRASRACWSSSTSTAPAAPTSRRPCRSTTTCSRRWASTRSSTSRSRRRATPHIDAHHTVEDVAITIGEALRQALGDKRGISRFGDATVPLDEALAQAVVDVSGRPYLVHTGEPPGQEYHLIGGHFTGSLTRHVLESIAHHAAFSIHVRVLAGRDPHHIVEAQFKALARALRFAVALDPRVEGIPSTKGAL